MIRDTVRSLARARIAPNAHAWEAAAGYPPELFAELAELGLLGMTIPEAYGGAGADYVSYAVALQELAYADGGLSTIVSVHNAPVCAAILKNGDAAQKQRFLPDLCQGRY